MCSTFYSFSSRHRVCVFRGGGGGALRDFHKFDKYDPPFWKFKKSVNPEPCRHIYVTNLY